VYMGQCTWCAQLKPWGDEELDLGSKGVRNWGFEKL
jgi:hypothetical protein